MSGRRLVLFFLLLIATTTCKITEPEAPRPFRQDQRAKNVILMIGDGMGLSQVSAALFSNNNRLILEEFPVIGFHKQHSYNDLITDSAAGATAFSCGIKTYNNAVGVSPDTLPVKTILEEAEERGYATGLVATSTIVHATPAAFIAHQSLRGMYEEIAADFLKTDIDFFVGGGKRYFENRYVDNRNLYLELRRKGYTVSDFSIQELTQTSISTDQNFAYFTADSDPLPVSAGRDYLPFASKLAANFLAKRSDEGFFLVIEGSQIDWACHANDAQWAIYETLDFDRAIREILAFAKKYGDTLVIVTADHECGGMAINPGSQMNRLKINFTSSHHTGTLVPVFAYGPSSELFSGIYDNTEIHKKMRRALGFDNAQASSASSAR